MYKKILQESILLTGPMSVGKSLIAEELSKRTKKISISVDEILLFAKEELLGRLSTSPEQIKEAFDFELSEELKIQSLKYHQKDTETLTKEISVYVQDYIDRYLFLREKLGSFEELYPTLRKYANLLQSCQSLNDDTYLAILQERASVALDFVAKHLKEPAIIDTPAHVGWKLPDFNFSLNDNLQLARANYHETPKTIEEKTKTCLDKFGYTVFLSPGIDYSKRHAIDSKTNFIMTDMIDQFSEYADIEVSVNGMFTNENDKSLRNRDWFDIEANQKHKQLKNVTEINNICNSIIELVEELKQENQMI